MVAIEACSETSSFRNFEGTIRRATRYRETAVDLVPGRVKGVSEKYGIHGELAIDNPVSEPVYLSSHSRQRIEANGKTVAFPSVRPKLKRQPAG